VARDDRLIGQLSFFGSVIVLRMALGLIGNRAVLAGPAGQGTTVIGCSHCVRLVGGWSALYDGVDQSIGTWALGGTVRRSRSVDRHLGVGRFDELSRLLPKSVSLLLLSIYIKINNGLTRTVPFC